MIVLKHVSKTLGRTRVLADVSFRVEPGEFVCLTGPSGAGKSTLLHLLMGAEGVTSGSIEVDSVDLKKIPSPVMQLYRRRVGVILQDRKLLMDRTVAENVSFPLEVCGLPDAVIRKRVPEVLQRIGLTAKANAFPSELNAGDQVRVAIGRAIALYPMIVLADEPTAGIDAEHSTKILRLLQEIHAEGRTVILATYDTTLAEGLGTRIIRIQGGKVIEDNAKTYDHAARTTPPQETIRAKHHIFSNEEASLPSQEQEVTPTPRKDTRKIRITSIGS
ncbi:MAG: ATP-binding cassette domain-containing protein [Candidatus Peregrinibacteria bacterium]|nr:ATP-binding cassette domain-containing protein [Candidatus Peregrinibacteria bacterium]